MHFTFECELHNVIWRDGGGIEIHSKLLFLGIYYADSTTPPGSSRNCFYKLRVLPVVYRVLPLRGKEYPLWPSVPLLNSSASGHISTTDDLHLLWWTSLSLVNYIISGELQCLVTFSNSGAFRDLCPLVASSDLQCPLVISSVLSWSPVSSSVL